MVDEVIAVGDQEFQGRCMEHMNKLLAGGTTIVLVSHSSQLVIELCDTVGWLDHGRMLEIGDPQKVVDSYLTHVAETGGETLTTRDPSP